MCLIFTDEGKIVERELQVLRGCCDDPERNSAYLIDHDNQFVNSEDRHSYQIVSERSCIPICLRSKKPEQTDDLKNLMNQIHRAAYASARRQPWVDAQKDKWGDKLLWIITLPFSTILAIYLISKIGS